MERPLEVSRTTVLSFRQVRTLLREHLGNVLSGTNQWKPRTYSVELTASRNDGHATVHELVEVELESIHLDGELAVLNLSWHAVKHARLFPTFRGSLAISPVPVGTMLRLAGRYEPPLGRFGAFGDGVIGHRLARQSVENYLDEVVARLERLASESQARPAQGSGPSALTARTVARAPLADA